MGFACPHCGFKIIVKTPRAGKFTPQCPRCHSTIYLSIPDDLLEPWTATRSPHASSFDTTQSTGPYPAVKDPEKKPGEETTQVLRAVSDSGPPAEKLDAIHRRPSNQSNDDCDDQTK